MVRVLTNTIRQRANVLLKPLNGVLDNAPERHAIVSKRAKGIAWAIFLILFIENDTLGLFPRQFYMVFRNVRLSDLILYGLIFYSLINVREYEELFRSKTILIVKLFLIYLLFQFIISVIYYNQSLLEYFFRLKNVWFTFTLFPFLLLLKRGGFNYLVKLILPVAIISNILYIFTATTGISFLSGVQIVTQDIPGGYKVYRVFGGTFYGEYFFLGFIYKWITEKFRIYQLPLVILFAIPHILAFGRGAWIAFVYTILCMFLWNFLRKKNFKIVFKQGLLISILSISLLYTFMKFIPQSSYLIEAIEARITQGEEDYRYKEGTYGTRLSSTERLIQLWQNSNVVLGIGMHPMWVIKPVTEEENLYAWGFADVKWASVLTSYGLIGFIFAIIYQIYYFILSLKVLKKSKTTEFLLFFIILMATSMFFETTAGFSTTMFSIGIAGLPMVTTFNLAVLTYTYEK